MKIAFSTVACPEWTLEHVASKAREWGHQGVELRTFGYGSKQFACDPALTAPKKIRAMFDAAGVEVVSLATSIRFDEPISPPVLGNVFGDNEKSVRACRGAIELAASVQCPYVRVYGFEVFGSEPRKRAFARIMDRLGKSLDAARNTGVKLLIENGGSFSTATDLAEIIDAAGNPLLGSAYSISAAWKAGEDPTNGINVLGDSLWCVKAGDYKRGEPCVLGTGDVPVARAIRALGQRGYEGWIVHEYPRAWFPKSAAAEGVLSGGIKTLHEWASAAHEAVSH